MKVARKSWHYRWRAWWLRRFGYESIIEYRFHTRNDYLADMFVLTVGLPLTLLILYGKKALTALERRLSKVEWPKLPQFSLPKREPRPPDYLEYHDCEEK